jgi:hypothetical protein
MIGMVFSKAGTTTKFAKIRSCIPKYNSIHNKRFHKCDEHLYFHLEKDPKRGLINVDNPFITLLQSAAVLDDDDNTDELMCTLTRLGFSE